MNEKGNEAEHLILLAKMDFIKVDTCAVSILARSNNLNKKIF